MKKIVQAFHNFKWEALLLVLVLSVLSVFVTQKEGYHMDELLSFELSNAEFNPWIVSTQPVGRLAKFINEEIQGENIGETISNLLYVVGDTLTNRGNSMIATYKADVYEEPIWIDQQQFIDYVTVDSGDAFNYLSVYFNVKDDNHPIFHFMLLHTVASLFHGVIGPWIGCSINIIMILATCVLLMKLGTELCGTKWYGIAAAALYGFSAGAIATTLLIRMYGVVTFFCVAELYLHLIKLRQNQAETDWRHHNKLWITVTVLGFLTQYFFLFYMIGLALVTMAYLFLKKNKKAILYYARTMCIAGVIGVGIFPFSVSHILFSGRGVESIDNFTNGFSGYGQRFLSFLQILSDRLPGGILGTILLTLLAVAFFLSTRNRTRSFFKHLSPDAAAKGIHTALLIVPFALYFLLTSKMAPFMVDRYIMPIFPIGALLFIYFAYRLRVPAKAALSATVLLSLISVGTYDGGYLFTGYENQVQIAENHNQLPCVCVYEGVGFYENLIEFTEYRETLLVTYAELENRSSDSHLETAEQLMIVVKSEVDAAKLENLLSEKYGLQIEEKLLTDGVHQDNVWLVGRQ